MLDLVVKSCGEHRTFQIVCFVLIHVPWPACCACVWRLILISFVSVDERVVYEPGDENVV